MRRLWVARVCCFASPFTATSSFAIGDRKQVLSPHRMNHLCEQQQQQLPPTFPLRLSSSPSATGENEESSTSRVRLPVTKIIVVGAGISGLSTAYNLWKLSSQQQKPSKTNLAIEILEVRDRIGGRVQPFSIDSNSGSEGKDIWIDLGGQWLHDSCRRNPIRRLMEDDLNLGFANDETKTKLKTKTKKKSNRFHKRKQSNVLFNPDGTLLDKAAIQRARTIFYKAIADLEENQDVHRLGCDLRTKGRDSISFRELLERRTQVELISDKRLDSPRLSSSFHKALNYFVDRSEGYEGGNFDQISAFLANNLYEEMGGPDRVVKGSYKSLLDAISSKMRLVTDEDSTNDEDKHCSVMLRQNARVERIVYTNSYSSSKKISLSVVENEGEASMVECDYCVCTVPLGVLQQRKIEFVPPLSQARQEAIDGIGMGLLNKIVFRFDFDDVKNNSSNNDDYKFWGDLKQFGICHEDPSLIKTYYDCTNDYYDHKTTTAPKSAILVQFLAGSAADRVDPPISAPFEGLTDQEAIDESLEALRSVFGSENVPNPAVSKVTRWRNDPWSCGSYSFAKIGSSSNMYDKIATPLTSRLLFAGEHTSKQHHSTVHGAWETGDREARRIFEQLK